LTICFMSMVTVGEVGKEYGGRRPLYQCWALGSSVR
jgi:hypothetical protein